MVYYKLLMSIQIRQAGSYDTHIILQEQFQIQAAYQIHQDVVVT